jgi:hypothetical protein
MLIFAVNTTFGDYLGGLAALTGGGALHQCPAAIPEKGKFPQVPLLQVRAATPNSPFKAPL